MLRLLLLVAMAQLGWSLTLDDCPFGLKRTRYLQVFGTMCYRFDMKGSKDYLRAQKDCKKGGGTLAMPKTAVINEYLKTQLHDTYNTKADAWIGLNDRNEEDTFEWEDKTKFNITTDYSNFGKKEGPRKSFIQSTWEDCVAINPNTGTWHDYHCENELFFLKEERHYVCEYKPKASSGGTDTSVGNKDCKWNCSNDLDCGFRGNKKGADGCPLCECEDS